MPRTRTQAFAAAAALAFAGRALAAASVGAINPGAQGVLTPIATGLGASVDLRAPVANDAANAGKLFITEQNGKVVSVQNGSITGTFLDLSSRLTPFNTGFGGYDERGLLGFAFDPDYANTGTAGFHKVYTWTSEPAANMTPTYAVPAGGTADHNDVLLEWTANANGTAIDTAVAPRVVLSMGHPFFNHDAGSIQFGPDKMLYLADGDGGNANDTGQGHVPTTGNAQTTTAGNLLGKILRIDPHGNNSTNGQYGIPANNPLVGTSGAAPEIYAYGLRNVYRMSFDRGGNHDLIAADVGQNTIEEVDKITSGGNYGWNSREGTFIFNPANGQVVSDSPGTFGIDPLVEYAHTQGSAIVGGFVYRGSIMPGLVGKYIFADYSGAGGGISVPAGRLFYADLATGQISEFAGALKNLPSGVFVKGLGEDANGEIYVLTDTSIAPAVSGNAVAYELTPEPTSIALLGTITLPLLTRRRRKC